VLIVVVCPKNVGTAILQKLVQTVLGMNVVARMLVED